jgi:hypothetical protein
VANMRKVYKIIFRVSPRHGNTLLAGDKMCLLLGFRGDADE